MKIIDTLAGIAILAVYVFITIWLGVLLLNSVGNIEGWKLILGGFFELFLILGFAIMAKSIKFTEK